MREIKFRGKRIDNGEWIVGAYIYNNNFPFILSHDVVDYDEEYIAPAFWWRVDPSTVGQYTGLKDKNGTEIYEGDIVKTTALLNDHHQRGATVVSPVEYWHGATCLSITYVPLSLDFQVSHEIEIIGNIHDNPELLGGAE